MTDIDVMCPAQSDHAAACVDGERAFEHERRVFYPYYRFRIDASSRALWRTRHFATECLVDARTGRAATAEELRVLRQSVDSNEVLLATLDATRAHQVAMRYASHALSRSFKVVRNFGLQLTDAGIVHRPFEIVCVEGSRLLFDTLTGDVHPLADLDRVA